MIAVDTNIISTLLQGKKIFIPQDELYIPYLVLAELQAGIALMPGAVKKKRQLDEFLFDANVTVSPGLSPDVILFYTQIYSYLRKSGTPISPNDLWIAAECMALSLPLLTLDKDFQNVPQIILVAVEDY